MQYSMWLALTVVASWAILSALLALSVGAGIRLRDQRDGQPQPAVGPLADGVRPVAAANG